MANVPTFHIIIKKKNSFEVLLLISNNRIYLYFSTFLFALGRVKSPYYKNNNFFDR